MHIRLHNTRPSYYLVLTSIAISSGYGKHVATLSSNQTTKQLKASFSTLYYGTVPGQLDGIYTY